MYNIYKMNNTKNLTELGIKYLALLKNLYKSGIVSLADLKNSSFYSDYWNLTATISEIICFRYFSLFFLVHV